MRSCVFVFPVYIILAHGLLVAIAQDFSGVPDVTNLREKRPFCNLKYGCSNPKRSADIDDSEPNDQKDVKLVISARPFKQSEQLVKLMKFLMLPKNRDTVISSVGWDVPKENDRKSSPWTNENAISEKKLRDAVDVAKRPFCNHFGCANGKRDDTRAVARKLRRWLAYVRSLSGFKRNLSTTGEKWKLAMLRQNDS